MNDSIKDLIDEMEKTYINIFIQFFLEEFQSIAPKISQSLILMIIFMMDLITYNDIYIIITIKSVRYLKSKEK